MNRLTNKKGFTFTELIAALAIFLLVSLMMVSGISFASKQYEKKVAQSQGYILYSTLSNAISKELRYARDPRILEQFDNKVCFKSNYNGYTTDVFFDTINKNQNGFGELVVTDGDQQSRLVNTDVYNKSLKAMMSGITANKKEKYYRVKLVIMNNNTIVINREFDVPALNL